MPRKDITQQYKEQSLERLYKLYSIKDRSDYEGSTIKYECTINGERGLFKERRSMQSKDHVMEQTTLYLSGWENVTTTGLKEPLAKQAALMYNLLRKVDRTRCSDLPSVKIC